MIFLQTTKSYGKLHAYDGSMFIDMFTWIRFLDLFHMLVRPLILVT